MKKLFNFKLSSSFVLLFMAALFAACAPAGSATTNASTQANSTTVSDTNPVSSTTAHASDDVVEVRIGYQRGGEYWNLLKVQGTLEKRFGQNVKVTWSLFP